MFDDWILYMLYIILGAISFLVYKVLMYPFYLSPLRKIPGPPSDSFLLGNIPTIVNSEAGKPQLDWSKKYGKLLVYHGMLNRPVVLLTDPKYYSQVLISNAYDFIKPKDITSELRIILGSGILFAEGDQHKRQRKIMNPAFSFTNLKEMVPRIVGIAENLKSIWNDLIDQKGEKRINIVPFLSKTTLDVIGLVGFQYEFNSLNSENELAAAYEQIFNFKHTYTNIIISILSSHFKWIRYLPFSVNLRLAKPVKVIERVSLQLFNERKNQAQFKKLEGKDLLTLLINVNRDLPPEEKISDEELKYQIMTFLAAGHETTSNAISWAIYLLSKHPEFQDRLRQELLEALPDSNSELSFDKINSLDYLNCVIKETMRVIPPVPAISRVSETDKIIDGHFVPKNTPIVISMYAVHNDPEIWGDDCDKFDPSRWLDPKLTSEINNLTYLPFITGPRSCIGHKLATIEIKIILSLLIRNFKFREVEGFQVKKRFGAITRSENGIEFYVSKVQ